MNILVVQDADWTKKGPHQQHHLLEKLSLKGHKILVIGFDQLWNGDGVISKRKELKNVERVYKGAKVNFIKPSFIKIKFLDYLSFFFSSRNEIKKSFDEFEPDIVVGFTSIISNYWGMRYAKKNKIPFIYYWTDVIHELVPFKPFRPIARLIEKIILKNSSVIISINEVLKDQIIKLGVQEPIIVIPGGVDFQRFNPKMIDGTYYRNKYGVKSSDTLLFFMGWLYNFSGLKEVIIELSKKNNTHSHIKLLIVGTGDAYDELVNLVESRDMKDRVFMTGQMPYSEIPKLIASADICLLPAYNNKIMKHIVPIKIYEYLAMQKPVISTELPGVIKEFGNLNGVNYINSPEKILEKLNDFNKETIEINSLQAKNFIKEYNWMNITNLFEKTLINICHEEIK